MEGSTANIVKLMLIFSLWLFVKGTGEQRFIPNLRSFSAHLWGGRFQVDRKILEDLIRDLREQDEVCGDELDLQLPTSWPNSPYDRRRFGEIGIYFGDVTEVIPTVEHTYCQAEDHIESFRRLGVVLSVVRSDALLPTMLLLASITDSKKTVLDPYSTSHRMTTYIDSIQDSGNGTVTFRNGDDVMVVQIQDDQSCTEKEQNLLEENFPGSTDPSSHIAFSSYPNVFDWGCDDFGSNFSFCAKLKERECDLNRFSNDICGVYSTTAVKRCPSYMEIQDVTGFFRDIIPLSMTESEPIRSIETESIDVSHEIGLLFPCFT
ncbi:uncharacterized protein [Apostichopus japonicus]|uniref:uncharacterized protein n=1 Tax=Stichopus japonicus TaxID=307972 RepID=UPI003AB8FAB3